eukprot:s6653_g1.t1
MFEIGEMTQSPGLTPLWAESSVAAQQRQSFKTLEVTQGSFAVSFLCQTLDHALVEATVEVMPLQAGSRTVAKERLLILRPGLGAKIARKPQDRESCAQQQHGHSFCGKDYEKPRLLPGMGSILEDSRRKSLFRLYTHRDTRSEWDALN